MVSSFVLFLPETILLVGALAALLVSIFDRPYRTVWAIALLAGVAASLAAAATARFSGQPFFPGIYQVDLFSQILKTGIAGGLFLVLLLGRHLESVRPSARGDLPFFLLIATAGMMLLVSVTEAIAFYVAMEMSAYALYIAVALHRRPRPGAEAGLRFVLFGAAASAVTLYGLSLIVGATGTTYLSAIAGAFASGGSAVLTAGLLLIAAGLFFKLAVFPFHFWAPDVYQGASHQVVAFVATTSKLAAIGIIARITSLTAFSPQELVTVFGILAVLSMTVGNLAAIGQRDLKRLLGYSAIAHAGYVMLGYVVFSPTGLAAALFYGLTYLAIALLAFVVVCAVGRDGQNPTLDGLSGLHQRSPLLALMLLVAMFGLSGIPPTAGFAGKWFLFSAAIEQKQFLLVLIAAINGTVSLYYYLRVLKAAYLEPAGERPAVPLSFAYRLAGGVAMAVALVAGIYPQPLWELARRASLLLLAG